MAAYILCTRDTRKPCTMSGEILPWVLAPGAVLIEDADLIPSIETDEATFLLLMEIDYDLEQDLEASPADLAKRYAREDCPHPVLMIDRGGDTPQGDAYWNALHNTLQDAVIDALITTESTFGRDAIAA